MNTIITALVALIGIAFVSTAQGQEKRSIEARINGWVVQIDYSDIDNLPAGSRPVSRVRLSHPSNNLKARMEVPFESFFALWAHLDSTTDAKPSQVPIVLPAQGDGAILKEGSDYFRATTSETAALLVRFWLDTFQHLWKEDSSSLTKEQLKLRGTFGYLLRHNPFPTDGNFLTKFTEKVNVRQDSGGDP